MYLLYAGGGSAACGALPHFAGRGNSEDLPGDGRAGDPEDQAYRRGAAGAAADAPAGGKTEKHAGDREGDSDYKWCAAERADEGFCPGGTGRIEYQSGYYGQGLQQTDHQKG